MYFQLYSIRIIYIINTRLYYGFGTTSLNVIIPTPFKEKDLKIDNEKLDIESLKTPELYGKYLKIYTRWNLLSLI